ncbi:kinase-like domain-containing protein [Roridomyces roridus]|uniref:Kinase-like domain-containing protein n=1 Tax=Roridomyces roridus TaxID=1738132 RepID=A0AAD7BTW1_9AGAR|nr:kinase-like domain-containing protein [Roridomyces roridus]
MPSQNPRKFIGAVEDAWELFSDCRDDYTLGSPIGFGASSVVYAAEYRSQGKRIPCALKVIDLDSLPPHTLELLQRETVLMGLSKHPNVLRVRGSFQTDDHKLCIALRLMNSGSVADVMRYGWAGGLEEEVIKTILQQALQGLNYLHVNGFIHRDVKAANLLIDDDGTVLLGDLGVAADLAEDTSRQAGSQSKPAIITAEAALRSQRSSSSGSGSKRISFEAPPNGGTRPRMGKRKSFVGTPCWMAPEVIQARHYDSAADIWSFGITALELTQGRPPRSRESPQKVLLKTIQEAPPSLDREGGTFKYSRAFKEIVDSCLVKDPSKRPTAEELLQSPFFKSSKKKAYLVGAILKDLPPLTHRQERRVAPGAPKHGTVDSWDFATTVHSPTTARHDETETDFKEDDIFEINGNLGRRCRNISWAEPEEEDSEEMEPENGDAAASSPESENSSPRTDASSPLMYASSEQESSPEPPSPMPPSSGPLPVPKAHKSESLAVPASSVSSGQLSSSASSTRSSPGLWRKFKDLRRRSSVIKPRLS